MTSNAHGVQISAKARSAGRSAGRDRAGRIARPRVSLFLAVVLLALAPAVRGQGENAPIVALPHHASAGTDDFYYLDLGTGAVTRADQLRRDPWSSRERRLGQNLFQAIGRPLDQPAAFDEILLGPIHVTASSVRAVLFVETSTGYVAYFDQLGRGETFGQVSTVIGRPFGAIASDAGNYALLMRHDSNGRTEGAYLYHAGSGRGFYLSGLARLESDVAAAAAAGFPRLSGQVCAAELQASQRTRAYLVADAADGSLRLLEPESAQRVSARDSPASLFPTFAAEAPTATLQRFVAVPVRDRGETTTHVLFVDTASGELAVLAGVEESSPRPVLTRIAANLYDVLGTAAGAGPRVVAPVEGRAGNGATRGVWLIDSLTRGVAFVDNPATPASATVRRLTIDR